MLQLFLYSGFIKTTSQYPSSDGDAVPIYQAVKEERHPPSPASLEKCLRALARERLTKKQKLILSYLCQEENRPKTATRVVKELSRAIPCSESALWNNINSLKRARLVRNGPWRPLRPTRAGLLIAKEMRK